MIGLDTSAIIDLFKGVTALKSVLENYTEHAAVTEMSYAELMFGLDVSGKKHAAEEKCYDAFFEAVAQFPLDKKSIKKASKIFWELKKRGNEIDEFDCLIAGIFLTNGITKLITRNKRHFAGIPGMEAISY